MKRVLLPVVAFSAVGSVALAEPLTLTDAQMDGVTAGQEVFAFKDIFSSVDENFFKNVQVNKQKFVQIQKQVQVQTLVDLDQNLADAEALAQAIGWNTFSEAQSVTVTTAPETIADLLANGSSTSFAESLSASERFPVNLIPAP